MAMPISKETRVGSMATNAMVLPLLHHFDADPPLHFGSKTMYTVAGILYCISSLPNYPCFFTFWHCHP